MVGSAVACRGMATMWCPQCGAEYREGFSECSDCGVALVADAPAEPEPRTPREPGRPLDPGDDSVELLRVNAVEAELIAAQLRGAGIHAGVIAVGTAGELVAIQHSEGSRVMVRRGDFAAAQAALADIESSDQTASAIYDADLATQAEAATNWSDPGSGAVV